MTDQNQSNLRSSGDFSDPMTVTFEPQKVGIGMTQEHYDAWKVKIKKAMTADFKSSIWLSGASLTVGALVAILIAVGAGTMDASTKAKFEMAAWGTALITALLVIFHCALSKRTNVEATEFLEDMDRDCFRVTVPRDEAIEAGRRAVLAKIARSDSNRDRG